MEPVLEILELVIVHAPDEFPEEDFLEPEEQLTLDMAFKELHVGVNLLSAKRVSEARRNELRKLLQQAHDKYLEGRDVEAAYILQELEAIAFKAA